MKKVKEYRKVIDVGSRDLTSSNLANNVKSNLVASSTAAFRAMEIHNTGNDAATIWTGATLADELIKIAPGQKITVPKEMPKASRVGAWASNVNLTSGWLVIILIA